MYTGKHEKSDSTGIRFNSRVLQVAGITIPNRE